MRTILFRGKRKYNGEWVEGFYYKDLWSDNAHYIIYDGTDYEVIPETVGQYTGLEDKNGKSIFENGYMIIDNKTYKVIFDNAEYILTNIFGCDIITLKNNSIKGVFVDEI